MRAETVLNSGWNIQEPWKCIGPPPHIKANDNFFLSFGFFLSLTLSDMHTRTLTYNRTHIFTHTYTCTHAHTHAHTLNCRSCKQFLNSFLTLTHSLFFVSLYHSLTNFLSHTPTHLQTLLLSLVYLPLILSISLTLTFTHTLLLSHTHFIQCLSPFTHTNYIYLNKHSHMLSVSSSYTSLGSLTLALSHTYNYPSFLWLCTCARCLLFMCVCMHLCGHLSLSLYLSSP